MGTLTVENKRADHSYPICIGAGQFKRWRSLVAQQLDSDRFIVAADANVVRLYDLKAALANESDLFLLEVTPGESRKNLEQYTELCETALRFGIDRNSVVVAIGGGVTGDIAGFMAATLLRGLRFVQIPTTLLAQVDSSVGGKTGVNAVAGKNLIGAFHQPELVIIDPAFLNTLPKREYLAGIAESLKYGIMLDRRFFDLFVSGREAVLARDHSLLSDIIEKCCSYKADVVGKDETEKGTRALLNLGHTFGHALESLAGYDGSVIHGEAVAVGIMLAATYAVKEGMLSALEAEMIKSCLTGLHLPSGIEQLGADNEPEKRTIDWVSLLSSPLLREALLQDKKASTAGLSLILPEQIGKCCIVKSVPVEKVAAHMQESLLHSIFESVCSSLISPRPCSAVGTFPPPPLQPLQ